MMLPLLTQFAKLFKIVGLGRVNRAAPVVWPINVLNDWILVWKLLQQPL